MVTSVYILGVFVVSDAVTKFSILTLKVDSGSSVARNYVRVQVPSSAILMT